MFKKRASVVAQVVKKARELFPGPGWARLKIVNVLRSNLYAVRVISDTVDFKENGFNIGPEAFKLLVGHFSRIFTKDGQNFGFRLIFIATNILNKMLIFLIIFLIIDL